jgi:hypothetical protein
MYKVKSIDIYTIDHIKEIEPLNVESFQDPPFKTENTVDEPVLPNMNLPELTPETFTKFQFNFDRPVSARPTTSYTKRPVTARPLTIHRPLTAIRKPNEEESHITPQSLVKPFRSFNPDEKISLI